MKIFLLLLIFFHCTDGISQSQDSCDIKGAWRQIFHVNTDINYENIIEKQKLTIKSYKQYIFSSPMMDFVYLTLLTKNPSYILNFLYAHYDLAYEENIVDYNDIYPSIHQMIPIAFWKCDGKILNLEFNNKSTVQYDIVFLDKEMLILARYLSNDKEHNLSFDVYLQSTINDRRYLEKKDSFFIVPIMEKYIYQKRIPITIK